MNHPNAEEWMAFLYRELPARDHRSLQRHLDSCDECRNQVAQWQAAMAGLERWPLPRRKTATAFFLPWWQWGLAALFLIGLGFGFGRGSAVSRIDRNELQAEIGAALQQQWRQEFAEYRTELADQPEANLARHRDGLTAEEKAAVRTEARRLLAAYAQQHRQSHQEELRQVADWIQQAAPAWEAELVRLRKDLETVAVLAENRLRRTQRQLVQLAAFNPDLSLPNRESQSIKD
jgi:hypothetical protein